MENIQIKIEKIVYPGKSLGYAGKTVFTDEGLPGEVVLVEIKKVKKNYIAATTQKILEPSLRRQKPKCTHYRVCGPYQVIEYECQLEIKQGQLKEIFSHQLHLSSFPLVTIPSPSPFGYRNRAHFHLLEDKGFFSLAYHQPESLTEFVLVEQCFLLPEKVNDVLKQVIAILSNIPLIPIKELEIRYSFSTGEVILILFLKENDLRQKKFELSLENKIKEILSVLPVSGMIAVIRKNDRKNKCISFGQNLIWETIEGVSYAIGPQTFFQVNIPILKHLFRDLKVLLSLSGRERVADLYCGVGTFGLFLASQVAEVYGVELLSENITFLNKNLKENRINNFFITEGRAAEWTAEILHRGVDIVFVDPPRRGLETQVVEALMMYPARYLLYLSCNPSTQVRDLGRLLQVYELQEVRFYDFFPQTPHIETLALLEKRPKVCFYSRPYWSGEKVLSSL